MTDLKQFARFVASLPEDVQTVIFDLLAGRLSEETAQRAAASPHYEDYDLLAIVVGGNFEQVERLTDYALEEVADMFAEFVEGEEEA